MVLHIYIMHFIYGFSILYRIFMCVGEFAFTNLQNPHSSWERKYVKCLRSLTQSTYCTREAGGPERLHGLLEFNLSSGPCAGREGSAFMLLTILVLKFKFEQSTVAADYLERILGTWRMVREDTVEYREWSERILGNTEDDPRGYCGIRRMAREDTGEDGGWSEMILGNSEGGQRGY